MTRNRPERMAVPRCARPDNNSMLTTKPRPAPRTGANICPEIAWQQPHQWLSMPNRGGRGMIVKGIGGA